MKAKTSKRKSKRRQRALQKGKQEAANPTDVGKSVKEAVGTKPMQTIGPNSFTGSCKPNRADLEPGRKEVASSEAASSNPFSEFISLKLEKRTDDRLARLGHTFPETDDAHRYLVM